jgi:hypothetical protein
MGGGVETEYSTSIILYAGGRGWTQCKMI